MSKEIDKEEEEVVVTLLSNGSSNLFKDNTLTHFSSKLHTPILLKPANHNYIALQEIGISLESGNIKVPFNTPAITYIEWDISHFLYNHPDYTNDLSKNKIQRECFLSTYEHNKSTFFINYPNSFGVYNNKGYLENEIYNPKTIEDKLKQFDFLSSGEGKLDINLVNDYLTSEFNNSENIPSLLQQFEIQLIKKISEGIFQNLETKKHGLLVHERLAKALKINTYFRISLKNNTKSFQIPDSLTIDSEPYFLYFLSKDEKIRGGVFFDNTITSNENDVINIDCNLIDPYTSNEKFCTTIATFNNVSNDQRFLYYYPNNRNFYKLRGNEIQDINIRVSDKDYKQLNLFPGIPTIIKLIIRSEVKMDFTSNLRVSSRALGTSNFYNKNSFFRVMNHGYDIFQSETSELSITSITYPNRFKVLPEYLNSNHITTYFMYSNQNVIVDEMKISSNDNHLKDISLDVSLDPLVMVSNLNKTFDKENIEWSYNTQTRRISIKTKDSAYVLQIPYPLGNLLGFQDVDVDFINDMTKNHIFKSSWFYNVFWTKKFIDVMKTQNNLSIYELLATNNFLPKNYFYITLSSNDEYQIKRPVNLEIHRPRYALVYNNIIEDSIVDNNYYKILKTIYFAESDTKWKTITYKNDEYKKIQEKNPLYLEFALRLPSGDLVEFENSEDDVVINLKTRNK